MAKERLSKLQRWILKHAFMKMKQMKMPDDWIWCRHDATVEHTDFDVRIDFKYNVRPSSGSHLRKTFFKYEILANYFHLPRSDYPSYYVRGRYFAGARGYYGDQHAANNHAHVTAHNCLKNMVAKGLITVKKDECRSNADEILLTKKGKALILYDIKTIKDKGIDHWRCRYRINLRQPYYLVSGEQGAYFISPEALRSPEPKQSLSLRLTSSKAAVLRIRNISGEQGAYFISPEALGALLSEPTFLKPKEPQTKMPDDELKWRDRDIETTPKDYRRAMLFKEANDRGRTPHEIAAVVGKDRRYVVRFIAFADFLLWCEKEISLKLNTPSS